MTPVHQFKEYLLQLCDEHCAGPEAGRANYKSVMCLTQRERDMWMHAVLQGMHVSRHRARAMLWTECLAHIGLCNDIATVHSLRFTVLEVEESMCFRLLSGTLQEEHREQVSTGVSCCQCTVSQGGSSRPNWRRCTSVRPGRLPPQLYGSWPATT